MSLEIKKNMLEKIDDFLNRTTMYRVVLYYLVALWVVGLAFSFLGILAFSPVMLAVSLVVVISVCFAANKIFAQVFEAPTNVESLYITAFILALIISPLQTGDYWQYLIFLGWVSVLAMASKYILAIKKKHVFNPAAFAVALTAVAINQSASWWVGSAPLLPFVLVGGILMVRKLRRYDLVFSFVFAEIAAVFAFSLLSGSDPVAATFKALINSPLFFFAFVMLTEPLTTPPTNKLQIYYGALTGFLMAPQFHLGGFYTTPETALLLGNVFSYAVSPKEKLMLTLKEKIELALGTWEFSFAADVPMRFRPGQYLEWTLAHEKPDSRGNRRYFTISSSPTEKDIKMGVKFYPEPSTFKQKLLNMQKGDKMVATGLAGDFVLPENKQQKLVFVAGGIGVTPFASMFKYLLAKGEERSITMLYSNNTQEEVAYKNIFDQAEKELGIKIIYALTKTEKNPDGWKCHLGRIDSELIKKEIPDFAERTFYISGPHVMVSAYERILQELGVNKKQIKTDFFPGFV